MNPDQEILLALAGGQPEAVAAIYRRHGARMLAFARRYVKTDGAADDVVSGLIGRWLERPPRVRESERLTAFLATSVYHAAIDWMRRERAEQGQPPRDPGRPQPHEVASRESPVDLRARLAAALEKLTPSERNSSKPTTARHSALRSVWRCWESPGRRFTSACIERGFVSRS